MLARSQVGPASRLFESQLGLNARIEEWEHRSVRVIAIEERILLRKIAASMLRRFSAFPKNRSHQRPKKKGDEYHLKTLATPLSTLAPVSARSHLCVALSSSGYWKRSSQNNVSQTIDKPKFFIEVAHPGPIWPTSKLARRACMYRSRESR